MKRKPAEPWKPSKGIIRGNAAEQVLSDVRDQILSGRFARGAKLPTEKELGAAYGVSSNTVREAIRGLVAAHLIEVKHGSGAYVTANVDDLIARSLWSIIRVGRIRLADIFDTYGAFNGVAAELAAQHATPDMIAGLQKAIDSISQARTTPALTAGVLCFLDLLSEAAGNPLLATFCRFLGRLQVDLFKELSGSYASRRRSANLLLDERQAVVDAIRLGDANAARLASERYQTRALALLTELLHAHPSANRSVSLSSLLSAELALSSEERETA